ncbi:MAG TPA: 3-hydroxyacyl-CoA dehydrogenase family protein [Leptospiraceae bacterium]|nr:3-hydroxyacyl-CoA dehydrogenase family protein [Leptospirales bacterium]HMU83190.1 3-hydroxyacyl-CoA dehydrogenase family protein [Leptospiraceae bacterium]HMX56322.1 3-hydroxyacyl-CoA dehydrogenase family protein [Leptospiraceae bacterium]HMZ37145.1 3-hydroxyacyl-CoA dehydrogenase family protein [Leptospiraceae bacterium]HNJ03682.1 3-hydroxyacyl-CoA dehydrogenase family protein [Leptospiraceae bacterium]
MREIKTVTVLGANGTMGANSAAIVAAFGHAKVHMLARSVDKAKEGIKIAVDSVRSGVIEKNFIPGTYDADLEKAVSESDWVFELVAEDYAIKEPLNKRIAASRKPGTIVSTVSSGLSIERLASHFDADGQKYYYGTHFFNPPYKLVLCELITQPKNDPAFTKEIAQYLQKTLLRQVILCNDRPGFAGNRIGFQLMNEAAQMAEGVQDKGGIALLDAILGGYTGRAMSPLATVDLVGLDVHKAIVDNIYANTKDNAHETFKLPAYMQKLIDAGSLGNKAGKGLYRREKKADGTTDRFVYNIKKGDYEPLAKIQVPFKKDAVTAIQASDYQKLGSIILTAPGMEADLLRHFIARYIAYSFSLIPDVTDANGVDGAMGFGFNWVPPTAWVDVLGGVDAVRKFIEKEKIQVPEFLAKASGSPFFSLRGKLEYRQLFRAG